jgi:hypothetical protein
VCVEIGGIEGGDRTSMGIFPPSDGDIAQAMTLNQEEVIINTKSF